MTSAHPPAEHNPHVHADVLVTQRKLAELPSAVAPIGPVEPDAQPVTTGNEAVLTAPPGSGEVTDNATEVTESPAVPPDTEGGEQPSPNPETAEPAGTDSSDSSSPDEISTGSSASVIPSPAPSAENPSPPAAKTESSTAGGVTGTGTDL